MSLKMVTLCLDATLETLRPPCCRRTLRLQGDLCRCLHSGSPQALQAVVTLSAHHALRHTMPSKTAHSLLSRVLRSALPES